MSFATVLSLPPPVAEIGGVPAHELTYIVVDGRCVAMAVPQSDACRAGHPQ